MPLSKLNVGDSVRIRLGQRDWTPVVVTYLHSAPRSYLVTTQNGRVYRPNRSVINPSAEPPPVVLAAQEEKPAFPKRSQLAYVHPGRPNPTRRDTTATIST